MIGATVLRNDRDGLATLVLNRPGKLNALNVRMFEELADHIDEIGASASIGCVVVRGAGRGFSAGHDLNAIAGGEAASHRNFEGKVIESLANVPQPVICAVHGACYTGGLELALAGDIILAATTARFADTHAKWGLAPVWGMSQRLPRRIGEAKAREMMFTCRVVPGAEAERIGLANACFQDDEFDDGVEKFVSAILENSWFSNAANKRLLLETNGLPLAAGLAHETYRNEGFAPDMQDRIAKFAARKS